jgi:hypothetical protein
LDVTGTTMAILAPFSLRASITCCVEASQQHVAYSASTFAVEASMAHKDNSMAQTGVVEEGR